MPKFRRFNNKRKQSGRVQPPPPLEFPVGSAEYVRVKNLESAQKLREKILLETPQSLSEKA